MSTKGELKDALTEFVKRKAGDNGALVCTVKSYDALTKTCYCVPLADYADVQQVRIIADATKDGFIIYPKVGSTVLVSFMGDSSAYISMFSEVDEIHLAGVNYGGLAKTANLVTKYNNLENKVNALITAVNGWAPVPNDGGAALKVALTAWLATSLTPTVQADISSDKVYHGDAT